jgi:alanine-glyoxylate transaminase/serine-glyoxylate transaminase/serine-pyruvate transaminase
LAGKVWRIGLMGYSSRAENILLCLGALGTELNRSGHRVDTGAALTAAESALGG